MIICAKCTEIRYSYLHLNSYHIRKRVENMFEWFEFDCIPYVIRENIGFQCIPNGGFYSLCICLSQVWKSREAVSINIEVAVDASSSVTSELSKEKGQDRWKKWKRRTRPPGVGTTIPLFIKFNILLTVNYRRPNIDYDI